MTGNPHFRELLLVFNEHGVEYLIVGGYAVMKYTEPRFTKDLDLWVRNSQQNAQKVFAALRAFGAPLSSDDLTAADFESEDLTYQIGVAPLRIDILTHIDGVSFEEAWPDRTQGTIMGLTVQFLSLKDLIRNKQASGRISDLAHLEQLRDKTVE